MEQYFIGQVTLKAILKYKDAFVLVREKNEDKYILPGGRLNVGENPENGIRREIKEELSVDCNIENIISVGAYHGGDISKNPKFFVYYLASVTPNQEIIINNEIAEFVLISKKEELENYPTYQSYKDALTPSSILTTYKDIAGTTHTKQDTYTYDNLARLTQVSTSYDSGTAIADTLTYDPIGNIIKENDVLYRYSQDGMQNAHGVTSIGSSHISYDAQGNRIQSGDSAYSWNALNQLVSATSTNGTELYTYDENGERIKKVVQASTLLNQKVTPATATSTSGSFASGDLLTSFSTSSTYIATSTYNTLSSLSLLSTTTLFTLVSSYYGSPFTSKFCAATSTANRQSCIVATTKQLLANDINGKSTTTASTNGLITDIIKIATGEYLIPDSYVGLATSSIASSDGGLFSIDSGTISSYSTFTSTGIVVVMSQYSNLPYVSSSTYTSLQQIGLNDTSKVKALLILAGCTSMTSACTTAEKVVFEKYYKESGYLLSDKALQEMWYVFAQKARLPGNSNEFTSTSTTLGNITIPTVSGISTSTATTTYYSNLYFTSEYTIRNSAELRLQFFNTIPYLVTQSTFAELQQAGITQTTMENYIALISDLSIAPVSSSTDYVTALNLFINLDKKASLSITALRELYLVALGAATIPDSASDYTDVSIYDLAPYLTVQTYYGSSFTNTTSGCNGGIYSGGVGRCAIRVSPFSLPVSSSSVVTYLLTINANTFTEASLNVGESSNPRGAVDSYNYPTQLPLVYSYYYSPGTSVNGNDFYSGTISADGLFQTVDVTTTIEKQKASSTEPAVILVMNHSGWNTSQQNAYLSRNVYVKAHVNTPRLTVASTSLMTLASGYVTTYWTATTTPSVSTSNIRAYYKLENTSDSVNSYTLSNEGSVTFGGGKIDNAASLGSSNTTKYLHADSALGFTSNADPLTVTCWVNAASTPSSGTGYTIINKMNGSGFGGSGGLWRFSYYNNGGTPRLQAGNDYGYSGINYNVTLSTSTWYLVGFTFDGTTNSNSLKMYVNGTTTGYTNGYGNGSFDEHATTLSIGSNRNGSAEYWSGSIDECSVWKAALSETDMSNLYNGGSGVQYPFGYSGDSVEKVSTSTQTASIQASVENYFGEVYDSSNDITLPTSTTTIPLTFISHDAYNEFASTTLIDVYDLSKIFLATTTSLTCIANSSTTQCDKLNRESNFKQIVGSYSGFIPSDTAVEEFWMVHKGILTLPYSTTSASVLYASSTNPIIVVNSATTSVNVFLRSWLSSSLSTTTATTSINLSAIPVGVLTSLQYNATYSTSTFALATSTTIVSEATYNELLHTPLRAVSDVYTVFDYALPYATSSCSGQAATSSCVISAQKTKTKDTISAVSGFILSDAALEELYRVYSGSISIVPVSKFNSTDSTDYQSLIVPLDTTSAFTTFSTTTVGATSTPSSTTGNCSFGTSGATSSLCYILIPYLNSSITALNLSFYVSTTTMTTGTLTSYLSYMTQDATSTGATSTPSFSTTVSTSTITGTRSGTKFTFDLTSLYNAYLRSSSPRLILIPDGNATSTNMYSLSSTTLTITRLVTTPQINYQEFSATTTTTTTTTTQGANVSTSTLKAYYKLENVNDSVNSYTLTNVNSVPFN